MIRPLKNLFGCIPLLTMFICNLCRFPFIYPLQVSIFEFFITCETVKDCELFEYDHRFDSIYNKVGMPILKIRPEGLQILRGFANFSCSNIKNGLKAYYELMKFQNCILKKNCCE